MERGVRIVKKCGGGGWDREFGLFRKVEVDDGKGGRMVKKGGGGGRMGREVGWFRKVEVEDGKGSLDGLERWGWMMGREVGW